MVRRFGSRRDRLDREAAQWLTRMRGEESERHRVAFERWYRSDPAHAEAYQEAAAAFADSGLLERTPVGRSRALPEARRRAIPMRYALAGLVALAVVLGAVILTGSGTAVPERAPGSTVYASAGGESRRIALADGSKMVLGSESAATVAFNDRERLIRLAGGASRFEVAAGARPFRVLAGEAEIVARGTIFEVHVDMLEVRVSLAEGSVEVFYPARDGQKGRAARRLAPGQELRLARSGDSVAADGADRSGKGAAEMLQFDDAPLAEVVEAVSRGSLVPLRLADPAPGGLRATGTFRRGDTEAAAQSLAAAFGLRVRRSDTAIFLHPRDEGPEK